MISVFLGTVVHRYILLFLKRGFELNRYSTGKQLIVIIFVHCFMCFRSVRGLVQNHYFFLFLLVILDLIMYLFYTKYTKIFLRIFSCFIAEETIKLGGLLEKINSPCI